MEFKRLGEVTLVEESMDTANVLIEENGEIKRVPKTEVGGTGFPTAIIKDSNYDDALASMANPPTASACSTEDVTFECLNMTFEEAYEIMASGGILEAIGMVVSRGCVVMRFESCFTGTEAFGVPTIILGNQNMGVLYWTADGLSTEEPSVSE